jgi:hypothetical protein
MKGFWFFIKKEKSIMESFKMKKKTEEEQKLIF